MEVTVYTSLGAESLYVPDGENVLDAIYNEYGTYYEYDLN